MTLTDDTDVAFVLEADQAAVPEHEFSRALNQLRTEKGPVIKAHFPFGSDFDGDGYIAIGYAEAKSALDHPCLTVVTKGTDYARMRPNEGDRPPAQPSFVVYDGPEHVAKRRVFTKHLNLKRVQALRPRAEQIVDKLLDDVEAAGPGADILDLFALKVPIAVLSAALGVPDGDGDEFVDAGIALLGGKVGSETEAAEKFGIIHHYFDKLVAMKRERPADDVMSGLVAELDATGAWSTEELQGFGFAALAAGHDAPSSILRGIVYWLAYNPDLAARLREHPDQIPAAVEEFLRFLPAGYGIRGRMATEDLDFFGTQVKQGQTVMAVVHLANQDPTVFERADVFDMDREPTPHIRFGSGPHICPGNQLARMELEVATRRLVERFPHLRPAEPVADWRQGILMRGPESLAVVW